MNKKRLLAILLICLGVAGIASAVEVISIDINHYDPNAPAYSGEAAVPGATQWIAYYGGWGVPMGSPKSAGLIAYNATPKAGTYAEQVWIGDPGNHDYVQGAGSGLLDDGFVKTPYNPADPNTFADPNVAFFGQGAYGGVFDMYVYADEASSFSIQDGNNITTLSIDGNFTPGEFVEGGNYVVFENVALGDPNQVYLTYTNRLSGIQLVSKKTPVSIQNGTVIDARNYDVAFDTNARDGEITRYGPDLGTYVSYLDAGEYMEYNITVTPETMGRYTVASHVDCNFSAASMRIYLDGVNMGLLTHAITNNHDLVLTNNATPVTMNLFPGNHVFKWFKATLQYHDIADFVFTRTGSVTLANCAEVAAYGFNYTGDLTGDCKVDLADLALLIADWANCYNPEPGACN